MKILNRYITSEFIKPFFFSLFLFSIVFQIGHLLDRMPVFMRSGVDSKTIALYLLAMTPLWLIQVLPLCSLIAVTSALGNMSAAGEITCLRASGVSTATLFKPLFWLALNLTLLTFLLGESLIPKTTFYARNLYRTQVDKVGLFKPIWENVIILAQNRKRIAAKKLDLNKNQMDFVMVEEYGEEFNLRQTLSAKRAEWSETDGWVFYDGVIRLFSKEGDEIIEEESFLSARIVLPEKPVDFVPLRSSPEELSAKELKQQIFKSHQLGMPALKETVQYHLKFAFPFIHLLSLLVGAPIALRMTPAGGGRGKRAYDKMKTIALSISIGLTYLTLMTLGEVLGTARKLPPWFAVWSTNFVFAAVGIYLIRKVE